MPAILIACSSRNGAGSGASSGNHFTACVFNPTNPISDAPTVANEREPITAVVRDRRPLTLDARSLESLFSRRRADAVKLPETKAILWVSPQATLMQATLIS
jgi:hypothetical protein